MKRHLNETAVAKIMEHLLERFGEPIGGAQGDGQGVPSGGGKKEDMGNRGFGAKEEGMSPATCDQCGGMMGMEGTDCTSCGKMPATITVGGHKSPRGATPGGTDGKVAAGVHPPKDMDGIPEKGSGRGTDTKKASGVAVVAVAAKPVATPAPMPVEMPAAPPPVAAAAKPMPTDLEVEPEDELEEDDAPAPSGPSMPKPAAAKPPAPPSGGAAPMSTDMDESDDELDEKAPPGREKQVRALKKKKGVKNPFAVAWASYNKSHGDE